MIKIVTDGSCHGNQFENSPGGWAAILKYKDKEKEIFGYCDSTTNNRMELTAIIEALKALKKYDIPIVLYSDSAYIINTINLGWYKNWIKNGWKTANKKSVKNRDLWIELLGILDKCKDIKFYKIKAHILSGDSDKIQKWYDTFIKESHYLDMQEYIELLKLNNRVDNLAQNERNEEK